MDPKLLSILAAVLCLLLAHVGTAQLTTCSTGRISLSAIPQTTFVDSGSAFTMGFCSAVQPASTSLATCGGGAGYVLLHTVTTGACTASMTQITTGLTIGTGNTSHFTVANAAGTYVVNVTMICDWSSSAVTAALSAATSSVSGSVTTYQLSVLSRAACPSSNFFCDTVSGVLCSSPGLSCINNICFDKSCASLSVNQRKDTRPANFISQVAVNDCHGTPMPNLTWPYFQVTLGGRPIDDPVYVGEANVVFQTGPDAGGSSTIPQVTTLLLDQSSSVLDLYEDRLREASKTMARKLMGSNTNHYVAVVLFDGAKDPMVLQTHTTNLASVLAALDKLPTNTTDPQSTNLYGAITAGLQEAYRMKFSFGNISSKVFSSVVLFTDGFDTSGRISRAAAVSEAASFGSQLTFMSVGISNTSDSDLLKTISNGYASFASGTADLEAAFDDITRKLVSISQNFYNILFCVPMRSSNVAVSVGLNTSFFPGSTPLLFTVDASSYQSGCSRANLLASVEPPINYSTPSVLLNQSGTLTNAIPAKGAFFFDFSFGTSQRLSVFPIPTRVLYATSGRCLLSPYCFDGEFNTTFTPATGTYYKAMAVSASQTATTNFIVTAQPSSMVVAATTTTPVVATGLPITSAPLAAAQDADASRITYGGDVDTAAAVIFFVFSLLFFLMMLFFVFYRCATRAGGPMAAAAPLEGPPRAVMLKDYDAPLLLRASPHSPRELVGRPASPAGHDLTFQASAPVYLSTGPVAPYQPSHISPEHAWRSPSTGTHHSGKFQPSYRDDQYTHI